MPKEEQKNIILKKHLIKIILAYSAIKIIANPIPPYSILNPDTSSDSPSAKSKGVRFVSAIAEINNIKDKGKNIIIFIHQLFIIKINFMLKLSVKIKKNNKIKANLISYEIVWAIARILPIKAYFLLEAHPLIIIGNTFKLNII